MRQSPAEIDYAILDVAAGFFAVHGFAATSLQTIADAVGYSKPGLLHRFGSKEALYRAVMDEVKETVDVIVDHVVSLHEHPEHLDQVLELVVRRALARPGVVQMVLAAFETQQLEPGTESAQAAGYRLMDAFEQSHAGPADRLRTALALRLIVTAAMSQQSPLDADLHVPEEQFVPMVRDIALGVLGHRDV
ncbi:TetR/AcrR family transcriptional regulator [Nocardioides sp. HDW12B]|uniref:TetR/AcrR family transcriptional regulator n=1 Tax=Nocardioides sp. HDW12B TaxID=2714939 RepID=UPI00197F908F|nr:TetR/AcrR family transcriptional regulator [Nocardioides sp. HDW12B]